MFTSNPFYFPPPPFVPSAKDERTRGSSLNSSPPGKLLNIQTPLKYWQHFCDDFAELLCNVELDCVVILTSKVVVTDAHSERLCVFSYWSVSMQPNVNTKTQPDVYSRFLLHTELTSLGAQSASRWSQISYQCYWRHCCPGNKQSNVHWLNITKNNSNATL